MTLRLSDSQSVDECYVNPLQGLVRFDSTNAPADGIKRELVLQWSSQERARRKVDSLSPLAKHAARPDLATACFSPSSNSLEKLTVDLTLSGVSALQSGSQIAGNLRAVQIEVEERLIPRTTARVFGANELPSQWQELLAIPKRQVLHPSVRDYQDSLNLSQRLLDQCHIPED